MQFSQSFLLQKYSGCKIKREITAKRKWLRPEMEWSGRTSLLPTPITRTPPPRQQQQTISDNNYPNKNNKRPPHDDVTKQNATSVWVMGEGCSNSTSTSTYPLGRVHSATRPKHTANNFPRTFLICQTRDVCFENTGPRVPDDPLLLQDTGRESEKILVSEVWSPGSDEIPRFGRYVTS